MKQFKMLSYVWVAVLCLGFASCSDDDDPTFEESQVVGTWTVTRLEGYGADDDGKRVELNSLFSDGESGYILNADHTGIEFVEDYPDDNFTWTFKDGNKLTFKYPEYSEDFKILQLNNSSCIVEVSGEDDGHAFYYKITMKKYNLPE